MARIYLFPKLGARTGDILTVQRFLNELGHAVELPSEGEKMYGTLLEGPVTDLDGHALIGWHRRTMDWADTLLAIAPLQASALLTAGYFAAQGKRSILLTSALPAARDRSTRSAIP